MVSASWCRPSFLVKCSFGQRTGISLGASIVVRMRGQWPTTMARVIMSTPRPPLSPENSWTILYTAVMKSLQILQEVPCSGLGRKLLVDNAFICICSGGWRCCCSYLRALCSRCCFDLGVALWAVDGGHGLLCTSRGAWILLHSLAIFSILPHRNNGMRNHPTVPTHFITLLQKSW